MMNEKSKVFWVLMALIMPATLIVCSSAASTSAGGRKPSSLVFPVYGNVYPIGSYYVKLNIGQPPKPYYLDVDTGSDVTWLQCDAPCVRCSKVPHPLYRPNRNNIILCKEPVCISLTSEIHRCSNPREQCDYVVEYADNGFSHGVLVKDIFPVHFTNGTNLEPTLAFGCGYEQHFSYETPTDGVLGLGTGKSSIISQLRDQGLTRNVIGHCYSGRGDGYLFLGDDLIPSSGVVWTPMSRNPSHKHYSPGDAELIYGGKSISKGLHIVFDTGSAYTYFNKQAYGILISSVRKDLIGKPLEETPDFLPICWKGSKSFKSISDVKKYFKPFSLSFTNGRKTQLELLPEFYLIITSKGNVCFGILNGAEEGEGLKNIDLIGDISLLDKLVIYDNERKQIGWAPANCDKIPKSGTISL